MNEHGCRAHAILLAVTLIAAAAPLGANAGTGLGTSSQGAAAEEPAGDPHAFPPPATTHHELAIGECRIGYRATAGTLPVGRDLERPDAHLFYVAYAVDQEDPATRPLAFVLNGGPGASAAYLHLGALGPQQVVLDDGDAAPPSPRTLPNPDTWLAFTDLVFIDPVETGFSRIATNADDEQTGDRLLGTEPDLHTLSAFVRLWLTRNERWPSPKFLVGESYGGFRVAALAEMLAERQGIQVNGAVLISPVLEFSLQHGDAYTLLPWVLRVPSFAAVAHHHGKGGPAAAATGDLRPVLDQAEAFALAELLPGLARGDALAPPAAETLYRRLAGFVGLPPDLVRRHAGRLPRGVFAKELLRADGRVVSVYDGSVSAIDPQPARASSRGDAQLTRLTATLAAAMNHYLRAHLGYETDRPYRVLNREVSRKWDWREDGEGSQGFIGAADNLKAALTHAPMLRVLIAHGVHDLVTPYFTSVYVTRQMHLDPAVRDALRVEVYEGGHMFYTRDTSRARLHADARLLFRSASAGQRKADASSPGACAP